MSSSPKVSICLPNLNGRAFLPERMATIYGQTFQDWRIIVSDNYSDDGAWEFFQTEARREPRLQLSQAPRQGMYSNWNNCIRLAQGEYVYVATSDDTMPPDCLEKLVAALEARPDCDIAHCPLKVIDIKGNELDFAWPRVSVFARSSMGLLERPHIRRAPYDGLLHLGGQTVYNSFTQLLVRRSLFDRVGLFCDKWGSAGDFNWGMRAGLLANTIHVPDTWGGWRVHPEQATKPYSETGFTERRRVEEMIDHAIQESGKRVPRPIELLLHGNKRKYFWRRWEFDQIRSQQGSRGARAKFLLRELFSGSATAWGHLGRRIWGTYGQTLPPVEVVAEWLRDLGFPAIEEVSGQTVRPEAASVPPG